jgi:hypothetical protein
MKRNKRIRAVDRTRNKEDLTELERKRFLVIEDAVEPDTTDGKEGAKGNAYSTEEAEFYDLFVRHGKTLQQLQALEEGRPIATCIYMPDSKWRGHAKVVYGHRCIELLVRDLDQPFEDAQVYFRSHDFHPFEDCYQRVLSRFDRYDLKRALKDGNTLQKEEAVKELTTLVTQLRSEMNSDKVQALLRRYRRNSQQRLSELLQMLEMRFDRFSRVLSVRVDFGYQTSRLDGSDKSTSLSVEEAVEHRDQLLDHVRKTYGKGFIGYAWAMEGALLKGIHFHFLLLFKGSDHCSDIGIADGLGKHWVQEITEGSGTFWNCNRSKSTYDRDRLGIGMLHRDSKENWEGLRILASYLTKLDFFLRYEVTHVRTFGKSPVNMRERKPTSHKHPSQTGKE